MREADDREIALRMREARELAGFSVPEAARALDPPVNEKTVRVWEAGAPPRRRGHLKQYADLCDVSHHWLLTGEPDPPPEDALTRVEARLEALERSIAQLVARFEQDGHQ